MPEATQSKRLLEVISALDSLHLNLVGDPQSSKFWVTFELFQDMNRGNPPDHAVKMRDSVVHDLVKNIAILKRDLDIEAGNLPSETESNLIAEIGKREQRGLETQVLLDQANEDIQTLQGIINDMEAGA